MPNKSALADQDSAEAFRGGSAVEQCVLPGCPLCSFPQQKTVLTEKGRELRTCGRCGVSYLSPQPSLADVTAHFENESAEDEELKHKFESNRDNVLNRVAAQIQKRRHEGKILDIGCATGYFLGQFFRDPRWSRWAVELSPLAARHAADRGIQVHRGNVCSARFAARTFDVISMLDAFCYIATPKLELQELHRILRDDGFLAIELPLGSSRIWRTSRPLGKWLSGTRRPLLESSDHLFYFTPRSISLLLESCGFEVETILLLPGNRQATLVRGLGFKAYFLLSAVLKVLSRSRVFLGPRFLVLAKKSSRLEASNIHVSPIQPERIRS